SATVLRANPRSAARVRDGGSMVPVASRPLRTASRSAVSSSSRTPRAPGASRSRSPRCRSRVPTLAYEGMIRLNHVYGTLRISVGSMTQTLDNRETTDRLKIYKTSPELLEAMLALSNVAARDVETELGELIKIRASQINHCAFCLDMHLR